MGGKGRIAWLLSLLPFLPVQPASAQSPNTATIVVRVISQVTREVVPGVTVTVTNPATGNLRTAVSGEDGIATISALPVNGQYEFIASGWVNPARVSGIVLRAGETAKFDVALSVGIENTSEIVNVYGTADKVRRGPVLGTRLDSEQINDTPLLGRKISYLPLLNASFRQAKGTGDLFLNTVYFVTGAGGRRQADFVVDGATGDEPWGRQTTFSTIPVGAVQEMNVMSRAFSAEFGWTSSAAINIVTKAGTNATHGEALVLGRPGGLQPSAFANDAGIVPPDIPDSLLQGSLAIGGALARDRTHYFFAGDLTRQDRTASITTPLVPAGTTFVGNYRQALANARLDHKLTSGQSLMARVNLDRFYETNPQDAVSGNVLPSAGRQFTRRTYGGQVNDTSILSASMLNEARFEYQHADPVTAFDSISPSTQFTRAGTAPFTSGESRFVHAFSRVSQFSDTLTWTRDKHYLRLGGSAAHSSSGGDGTEFGAAFVLGQYTVNTATTKPPGQLLLSDIQRYQQSFNLGEGAYELNQWLVSLFAQDSVRVHNDVTVDLGVRYDRQTFTDGTKNVSPRVGFGWNPGGDPKTAVRGGYGLYYAQIRGNTAANFVLGGPQGIFTYQATPGQTGFPACLACTPVVFDSNASRNALPARNITIRPGLASYYTQFFDISKLTGYGAATFENPKSQVGSIGIERQIAPRFFVSADYVKQHWTGLDRSVDLNAPSFFPRTAPGQVRSTTAADATRPIVPVNGGFRTISVVENLGVADYDGLQTMARWQGARGFASVSYTLSRATNTTEPDGNGAAQSDFNQLGEEERGPSLLDQRHRAVIALAYRVPFHITAGSVMQFASARPFNPTTGVDNNGDGNNNDRPIVDGALAGRYSFRGTATSDVTLFAEGGVKMAGRSLLLRIEGFNVFNHANILGRNGTYGDTATPVPTFGQALPGLPNVDPGRMVQFEARFSF